MISIQLGFIFNRKKTINNNISLKVLQESDIIIVCGGGFLGGKKFDSLMHIYQIYIDTLFKKPVYIMGTSIEPISNIIIKKITNNILRKVDFVFARERITKEYLQKILPNNKYIQIPDMAFMLENVDRQFDFIEQIKKSKKTIIGITIRKWKFPDLKNKHEAMENYIESIRKFMIKEIDSRTCVFVFVPQVTVSNGNDTEIAKEIRNRLSKEYQKYFIIREDDWSPSEIKSLIANMDFFVGTRMHSNIFATSMYIPTTAIAYEKKTNGIMENLGLEDYIVEINDINYEKLYNTFEKMIKNEKIIKKQLHKRIKEIREEIELKIEDVIK